MVEVSKETIYPAPPEEILPPPDWFEKLFIAPVARFLPPPFNCSLRSEKERLKKSLEEYRNRPVVEAVIPGSVPLVTKSTALTDGMIDRMQWAIDNYIPDCE